MKYTELSLSNNFQRKLQKVEHFENQEKKRFFDSDCDIFSFSEDEGWNSQINSMFRINAADKLAVSWSNILRVFFDSA